MKLEPKDIARWLVIVAVFVLVGMSVFKGELQLETALAVALSALTSVGILTASPKTSD